MKLLEFESDDDFNDKLYRALNAAVQSEVDLGNLMLVSEATDMRGSPRRSVHDVVERICDSVKAAVEADQQKSPEA